MTDGMPARVAWPLGDVHELLLAWLRGDRVRERTVLERLAGTACVDGSLPEARESSTGAVRPRPWFARPGAALVLALSVWR